VTTPLRSYGITGCSVDGCAREHAAGGLCYYHWSQARKPSRWRQRTPAEVKEMRQLHSQGVSFEELARRFACAPSTAARTADYGLSVRGCSRVVLGGRQVSGHAASSRICMMAASRRGRGAGTAPRAP